MKRFLLIFALLGVCASARAQCPATDSFSGSGALNSSNWTQTTVTSGISALQQGSGNAFPLTNSTQGMAIWIGSACDPTGDQQVQAVPNALGGGSPTSLVVRGDAGGDGYFWLLAQGGIAALNALGFNHTVVSCPAFTAGHTYKLVASGSTISGYDNGTLVCSGTDTTFATGHVGIAVNRSIGITDTLSSFQVDVPPLSAPGISPGTGTYTSLTVTIGGEAGATTCITTDGSTPTAPTPGTCSGGTTTTYTGPFPVTTTTTVNAISTQSGRTNSAMSTATYTIRAPITWFVRLDGGTNVQCDGKTNHALAGASGTNCAFRNPMEMVNSAGTGWTNFSGGDTMQFADPSNNTTPYYIGEQNAGVGIDWHGLIATCNAPNTNGNHCVLPPFPSGTSAHHTQIIGQNAGACHLSNHTGLVTPTILSGINDAFAVMNAQGSQYLDISCIEATQPDACTISGNGNSEVDFTSLASGTGTYIWHLRNANIPLVTQAETITGTTNGGGVLNGVGLNVAANNPSTYTITSTQATGPNTAIFGYTVLTGEAPVIGQGEMEISGTTNGGGQFNSAFGLYCAGAASVTAVSGSPLTTGTFTITTANSCFSTVGSAAESGSGLNPQSGTFTVTGIAGSASQAAETGTVVPTGFCTQANNYMENGLVLEFGTAQGPSNMTLNDFAAIGGASRGIIGSHLNLTGADSFTAANIFIIGNGFTGWDGDGTGCNTSCETVGTMNVSFADIEFNGCVATTRNALMSTNSVLNNTFNYCFQQGEGGQGDGWVQIAAGNMTLNIDHSFFRYNTQDGADLLHLSDDVTTNPVTHISTSWSEGNSGQTFKIGAATTSSAINNVSISNCRIMSTPSAFPSFPTGWAAGDMAANSEPCRAAGDQWSFQLNNGSVLTLENNTSLGYGATMYDLGCAFFAPSCGANGAAVVFTNNISVAYPDPGNGGRFASGWLLEGGIALNTVSGSNNDWFNMRSGCPDPGANDTAPPSICLSPLLVGQSNIDQINPNVTSPSPVLGAGTFLSGVTTDYNGMTRPNPPAMGAFELPGTPTVATPTFSPPAGSYGPTQTVTISTTTPSASLIFTNNGSTPTVTALTCTITNGTLYSGPISVSTSQTLKAIGCLATENASAVATAAYVINGAVANPTCSPVAGTYTSTQTVTCSSVTGGSTTVCTIDGSTPNHASPLCTSISVATSLTLKALAFEAGFSDSSVISNVYTILSVPSGFTIKGNIQTIGAGVQIIP